MNTETFTYKGAGIRADGERLNLTDMWKAAGAEPSRRPIEWLRSADAKNIIGFLERTLIPGTAIEVGNSHLQLIEAKRGGKGVGGTTWAHWIIGTAYAEYLSAEFHVWCITVVRDRMEGKLVPAGSGALTEKDFERLTAHTQQIIAPIVDSIHTLAERVDSLEKNLPQRRPILPKTKETLIGVIAQLGRRCPCCGLVDVVDTDGKVLDAEFDHFFSNQLPTKRHAWLICKTCHRALTDGKMDRVEADSHFVSFQRRMDKLTLPVKPPENS